mmetsp:Transcript_50990/g.110429  ORF Transcript_50990/g.110429 Transcript_50990/m.110429 type:complete len:109 (+) Transcript_50990:1179-1505(+)
MVAPAPIEAAAPGAAMRECTPWGRSLDHRAQFPQWVGGDEGDGHLPTAIFGVCMPNSTDEKAEKDPRGQNRSSIASSEVVGLPWPACALRRPFRRSQQGWLRHLQLGA